MCHLATISFNRRHRAPSSEKCDYDDMWICAGCHSRRNGTPAALPSTGNAAVESATGRRFPVCEQIACGAGDCLSAEGGTYGLASACSSDTSEIDVMHGDC
mmetsp:Transcript_47231/g.83103  ORF Transcript_47231/g.83103 Transcript_47231/m.83103 type:complete len:101 (-) Transcript_47231:146-448(-)